MGEPNNAPENQNLGVETHLKQISTELEQIKHHFVAELSQDIEKLQSRKNQLLAEIEALEKQRQEQLTQQQQLSEEIAPAIANQVQQLLQDYLNSSHINSKNNVSSKSDIDSKTEKISQLIASLDSTLTTTFRTLQQDVSSYQSALSKQLAQMYSLQEQGEGILETLIQRIQEKLQQINTIQPPSPQRNSDDDFPPPGNTTFATNSPENFPEDSSQGNISQELSIIPQSQSSAPSTQKSNSFLRKLGFLFPLISALALSFHHVVVSGIQQPISLFGLFESGKYLFPSIGNSFLIVWVRLLALIPLIIVASPFLYPATWSDIKQRVESQDWKLLIDVIISGFLLFLSLTLLYFALGLLSPGIAVSIFFLYPSITLLLSWLLFRQRPSRMRGIASLIIVVGISIILIAGTTFSLRGIAAAIASSIIFACYLLFSQIGAKTLHPVPFNVLNLFTMLIFAFLSLSFPLSNEWRVTFDPQLWPSVTTSGLILGGLALLAYLTNNLATRWIPPIKASLMSATCPVFTALLAAFLSGEILTSYQVIGILIVTFGIVGMSWENASMRSPKNELIGYKP